jgi:hypothetical protein
MLRFRSLASLSHVGFGLLLAGAGCAQAEGFTSDRGATGGADGETGGTSDSGGTATGGMATSSGGTTSTGGTTAKGGTTSTGGTAAKGGTTSTGGTTAKGGTTSTGGTTAKGGTTSTGGIPGKSGDVLLSDDFEDQDAKDWYAADMNGTRAVAMQDDSYAYVMTTASDKALSVGGVVDWTDQRVEAKVKFVDAGSSPVIYLMARWAEEKSYIVIEVRPGTTAKPQGDMKLRQTFGGSTQDLCRFKPASLLPGTWYKIGVSVSGGKGATATLLFDGQPVAADVACVLKLDGPSNGGVAVGAQNVTAAFDDIVVTVP